MSKIKLVTVSDDRQGRKGGQYQATQQRIAELLGDWIEQSHWNIADIPPFSPLLANIDAAKNGRVYKPWVVLTELAKLDEGDYLIYNDCSPELWEGASLGLHEDYSPEGWEQIYGSGKYSLDTIRELTDRAGGILVGFVKWDTVQILPGELGRHTHRYFTLDNLLYQPTLGAGKLIDSFQCASGMICIRKNDFTLSIIQEWLRLCCVEEFSCMNYDETENSYDSGRTGDKAGNRHDQSILSLLLNIADRPYVDIVYNELNPYNFLNFCLPEHDYKFINSNTGEIL